jgi:dihydrofolate reductase
MPQASRFSVEGYVIVSADGMLARGDHVMPRELKFDADTAFFSAALDRADLVVHGRLSQEDHPNSPKRRRIILTHKVASLATDSDNPKAVLWNPAGSSHFEAACQFAGVASGRIAVIGGRTVFDLFMDRFDTFWLSQAAHVRLPGGEPCFSGVPQHSPQQVLAAHGLTQGEPQTLDAANDVTVTPWRRLKPHTSP